MTKNNTYLASKPRYEILDGLRGVAAVLVVAYHLAFHFSKVCLLQDQKRPAGGYTFLPLGVVISYRSDSEPDFADIIVEVHGPLTSLSGFAYPFGIPSPLDNLFGLHFSLFFA